MTTNMTDAQTMAVEMFKDAIPCVMSLNGDCSAKATWLVELEHRGQDCGELKPNPCPFCEDHKHAFVQGFSPFWIMFIGAESIKCSECGVEIAIGEVTPI